MKILKLLGLDAKSKDDKAQKRKANELAREQDILINELSALARQLGIFTIQP